MIVCLKSWIEDGIGGKEAGVQDVRLSILNQGLSIFGERMFFLRKAEEKVKMAHWAVTRLQGST